MPALPTVTVTDAQLARLTSVFPGATSAEKAKAYQNWLVNKLIDLVLETELGALEKTFLEERQRVEAELMAQRNAKQQEIINSLPPRP